MDRETIYEDKGDEVRVTIGTVEIGDKVYTFSELGELVITTRKRQNPVRDIGAPAIAISLAIPGFSMGNMNIVGLAFVAFVAIQYFFKPFTEYVLQSQGEPKTFELYADLDPEKVATLKEKIAQARAKV